MMSRATSAWMVIFATLLTCPGDAMGSQAPAQNGIQLNNARTERWQVGVFVRARGGPVTGIAASMPIPMSWPEQDVKIVAQQVSPGVRPVRFRVLDDGVKQMLVSIPRLPTGAQASALVTLEITKRDIVAPRDTAQFVIPSSVPRKMRKYLLPSPYIESNDRQIRQAAGQLAASEPNAWRLTEAIFDWVREKVDYRFDRHIKGARQALEDGYGDCEELTSLFVAMCRAVGIPARAVWIPGHCYPEFYLEDSQGNGHWIPCQAAGSRIFGAMPEARPILQKGDNFRVPGTRSPQRYVQETLAAKNAVADPEVKFIRQKLAADGPKDSADH